MKLKVFALAVLLLASGCGRLSPIAQTPSPSPADAQGSTSAAPGALVVSVEPESSLYDFGTGTTTLHFLHEDGSEAGRQTLKPGVRVLAAAGSRVFLLEKGGVLKSVRADGNVQELGNLGADEITFLPSPDGSRWLWSPPCCAQSRTVHLGGVGLDDRVVMQSREQERWLRPYRWTAAGAVVAHSGIGIGGYILYDGPFGSVDELNPDTGTVTPLNLRSDCEFSDLAVEGTIACLHMAPNGSSVDRSLKLVQANGKIVTVPIAADYHAFGDAFFSPDGRTVTLDESPVLGTMGNADQLEQYHLELVNAADGARRGFGPENVKPDYWLPDGNLVVHRPQHAAGGLPASYLVQPDGTVVNLGAARAIGYLTSL